MRLLTGLLLLLLLAAAPAAEGTTPTERKSRFTVSPDTTYVTGPVRRDGTIDYVAALNERLRQGVAPTENACVLLWYAFGPHPEGGTMPPEFFQWLGTSSPPERGTYYLDLFRYMRLHLVDPNKNNEFFFDLMDQASLRPWTTRQYPLLAAWLKYNERPLALTVEATHRPKYYSPLVPGGDGPLIACLIPHVQRCRELANTLVIRAMWHAGEGRHEQAIQDLLALHRLARHVGAGSTLIEKLVGIAIDHIAGAADVRLLNSTPLDARRVEAWLKDLRQLPPMRKPAESLDGCERFLVLDSILLVERHGVKYLFSLIGGKDDPDLGGEKVSRLLEDVNWDPALRSANRYCDRLTAAMHLPTRGAREDALNLIENDLRDLRAAITEGKAAARALTGSVATPEARGQVLGDLLLSLLMPSMRKVQQASDRLTQNERNLHVAFALAAFQRANGHYPRTLEMLVPTYLPSLPPDLFNDRPLIYRPLGEGCMVYSVGVNGKDDGGRSYDDDPPGDDLVVRLGQ
jgi:hypothetical protein